MTTQTTTTQPAAPVNPQQPGLLGSLTPIALMVLVFYFLIMRPQQKREANRRELIASAKKGDRIVTTGGIIGVFHKAVGEKEISLEIAENVRIRVLKDSVTGVLEKGSGKNFEDSSDKDSEKSSEKGPGKSSRKGPGKGSGKSSENSELGVLQ
jgi:preprotein translocase subunit YajC